MPLTAERALPQHEGKERFFHSNLCVTCWLHIEVFLLWSGNLPVSVNLMTSFDCCRQGEWDLAKEHMYERRYSLVLILWANCFTVWWTFSQSLLINVAASDLELFFFFPVPFYNQAGRNICFDQSSFYFLLPLPPGTNFYHFPQLHAYKHYKQVVKCLSHQI